jgi:UDP-glucose 4-epimerase
MSRTMTKVLITGGAGFIGSHTCLVLLQASPEALRRVVELAGPGAEGRLQVIEGDIRRRADLERPFAAGASTVRAWMR